MSSRMPGLGDFATASFSDGEEPMSPPASSSSSPYILPSANEFKANRVQRKKALKYKRNKTTNCTPKFSLPNENFTVKKFGSEDFELFPALETVPLRQAVNKLIESNGLHLNQVDFFLENSCSALPLSCETFRLANKTIIMKTKHFQNKDILIPCAKNEHSNPNSPRLINGERKVRSSDDIYLSEPSPSSASVVSFFSESKFKLGNRKKMQSLLNSMSIKPSEKMDQLMVCLMSFANKNLPQLPPLILLGRPAIETTDFFLESHWSKIVASHEELGHREKLHQEAVWELIVTELNYISKLKVVVDLFVSCLFNLQNDLILNEIEVDKCFGRIVDVYYCQCQFWKQTTLPCLRNSRDNGNILSISYFKEAFEEFENAFEASAKFCLEQEHLVQYFKTTLKNNDLFKYFIAWAETQPQCNRLTFLDLIAEPLMRLTKYQLLFIAVKKSLKKIKAENADEEGGDGRERKATPFTDAFMDEELNTIELMIEKVIGLTTMTNSLLMKRQDLNQLSCLINRIDLYEPLENNEEINAILCQYTDLDLTLTIPGCSRSEQRVVLYEANLKLKESVGKIDVVCILLTDMILLGRYQTKRCGKLKLIRSPIRIDHVIVYELKDPQSFLLIQLSEYGLLQSHFHFFGETKTWIKKIEKAKENYAVKRRFHREHRNDEDASSSTPMTSRDSSFKSQIATSSSNCLPDGCTPIFDQSNFFPWMNWEEDERNEEGEMKSTAEPDDGKFNRPSTRAPTNLDQPTHPSEVEVKPSVDEIRRSAPGDRVVNLDDLIDLYLENDRHLSIVADNDSCNNNGTTKTNDRESDFVRYKIDKVGNEFRNFARKKVKSSDNLFRHSNSNKLIRTTLHLNV